MQILRQPKLQSVLLIHSLKLIVLLIGSISLLISTSSQSAARLTTAPSSVEIVTSASPPTVNEPGADVTYIVTILNRSAVDKVTITTINDDKFGVMNRNCTPTPPALLAPGTLMLCSYTRWISGGAGATDTNVITVTGADEDGNPINDHENATVTIQDVASSIDVATRADPTTVAEPGGWVTYTVATQNSSIADNVIITQVVDDSFGDVSHSCTPALPAILAQKDQLLCTFSRWVTGAANGSHSNVVTASGIDDDGATVSASDDEIVAISDVASSLNVVTRVTPTLVAAPGGTVTYTVAVRNTSRIDSVNLAQVIDGQQNDLSAACQPTLPVVVAPGGVVRCTFSRFIRGNAGATYTNAVTATGVDDDGNSLMASDNASVSVNGLSSSVKVVTRAIPTDVDEPGGNVYFSTHIVNTSVAESVVIRQVEDSQLGDISNNCTPALPLLLAPGDELDCAFTTFVAGNPGDTAIHVTTVATVDGHGNRIDYSDDATVNFNDTPATLDVTQSVDPPAVNEPGGWGAYRVKVKNRSPVDDVTIRQAVDSKFGDIGPSCLPALPARLAPNASLTCTLRKFVTGNVDKPYTNLVAINGVDDDGNPVLGEDAARMIFMNIPAALNVTQTINPVIINEAGITATDTVIVKNSSIADNVTITQVIDQEFGNVSDSCTPALPTTLAIGAELTCTFSRFMSDTPGAPLIRMVTAIGVDDDGAPVTADNRQGAVFATGNPAITVTQHANAAQLPATSGNVTFTLGVANSSSATVTLVALTDSLFGDLNGQGTCATPQAIRANSSYTCAISELITTDNPTQPHQNVVTATVRDEDGHLIQGMDGVVIPFEILVDIAIHQAMRLAPTGKWQENLGQVFVGAPIEWRIVMENRGNTPVNLSNLSDTLNGQALNLADFCESNPPATLNPGQSYRCTITNTATYNHNQSSSNAVSVQACFANGACDSDKDTATYIGLYWGFTPGFWKNYSGTHPQEKNGWQYTAYTPVQKITDLFAIPSCLMVNEFQPESLLTGLGYQGNVGLNGAAESLLRAAISSLLNASFHETYHHAVYLSGAGLVDRALNPSMIYWPYSSTQIITLVNITLASCNYNAILQLTSQLDAYNNGIHQMPWGGALSAAMIQALNRPIPGPGITRNFLIQSLFLPLIRR